MNRIWGVIPARIGSSRFPEKPLAPVLGKPLLQWVIEGAKKSKHIDLLLVATDDQRIADLARRCEVEAIMTASELPSGSDRVWAAVQTKENEMPFGVINIQGDEPLITGEPLDTLAQTLRQGAFDMVTLGRSFTESAEVLSPQTAKIVVDDHDLAVYFSRFPIPYSREEVNSSAPWPGCLKHIGIYGYTLGFLKRFCEHGPSRAERSEGLEQLRALALGAKIKVLRTAYESWGVDTPADVVRVERKLKG